MNRLHEGERVDLTIKGARVADSFRSRKGGPGGPFEDTGEVLVLIVDDSPSNERSMTVNLAAPSVTVQRAQPDHWPPMVGGIWADHGDRRWLVQNRQGDLRLIPVVLGWDDDPLMVDLPKHFLDYSGPVRLVYREEAPF